MEDLPSPLTKMKIIGNMKKNNLYKWHKIMKKVRKSNAYAFHYKHKCYISNNKGQYKKSYEHDGW